jgi:hypothetical protein
MGKMLDRPARAGRLPSTSRQGIIAVLATLFHKGESLMKRCWAVLLFAVPLCATAVADDTKAPEGFTSLFNGKDLDGWKVYNGKMDKWGVADGLIFVEGSGGGWLFTEMEYSDFEVRVDFKLPKGGNSGVALRSPREGDPAYKGMEIQLLDDRWYKDDKNYKGIKPVQLTGAIYGVVAPSKDATKPAGEWNTIRIIAKGRHVTVELNGVKTVDADLDKYKDDHAKTHPGILREKGFLGLQSHSGRVEFRNVYVKAL